MLLSYVLVQLVSVLAHSESAFTQYLYLSAPGYACQDNVVSVGSKPVAPFKGDVFPNVLVVVTELGSDVMLGAVAAAWTCSLFQMATQVLEGFAAHFRSSTER